MQNVTVPLQELTTLAGKLAAANVGSVNQPQPGWIDATNYRDAAFDVRIWCKTSGAKLIIQTASAPEGPWHDVKEYTSSDLAPLHDVFVASSRSGATYVLERYIRWRIDVVGLALDVEWELCFAICVNLKQ